jgi:hypothetical protein
MPFFVKGEKITLKRDGTWVADGTEITHEQTRDLFYRSIKWDAAEKKYYLEVGYERIFIEVEDTPFFVTSIDRDDDAHYTASLSDFTTVSVKSSQLSYENGNLYLTRDDGQRAKFLSPAYYAILAGLQEDSRFYYLTIGGARVNLSPRDGGNPASHPAAPRRRG